MKVFLTLQAALIAVTLLLCLHAKGLSEDVGITRMDTIEKIHNSNCDYIAVIHDTEELYDRFSQFDSENADYGIGLYGTAIFVGTPQDSFSFSKGSTFCTLDVDKVIKGNIKTDSIDVEIKGGFHYETEAEFKERLMNAEDMEIETPSEKLFSLDFGGMNFMVPGKKYLIIAQTLDFKEKTVYQEIRDNYKTMFPRQGSTLWRSFPDNPDEIMRYFHRIIVLSKHFMLKRTIYLKLIT